MSELAALVRFVHLTAAIVLAGGFGFHLFVARPAFASAKEPSDGAGTFIGVLRCGIFVGALPSSS